MIRNAQCLIAYPLLAKARLAAELDGMGCVEDWIEVTLSKALDARPELSELYDRREKHKKWVTKRWREKYVR